MLLIQSSLKPGKVYTFVRLAQDGKTVIAQGKALVKEIQGSRFNQKAITDRGQFTFVSHWGWSGPNNTWLVS